MKQRWIALAAALLLAPSPGHAAEPIGEPGGVLRATLPNGLRVVVVPDKLAPVVTTELSYLAGSNDAPEGFPGTAHALEHMMFRGSDGLDRDQLAELGALLGGVYNASTTETVTKYTYTVPSDDLGLALHSEALRMGGLSLNQSDWEQERGAIEQEVSRDFSSPFYTYVTQAQALLFGGTPYSHDALGTRPSFDKTDAALLRRFYETWYAPNNAILVIAGDVQPQAALAEVQAAFGGIPRREVPPHAPIVTGPGAAQDARIPDRFLRRPGDARLSHAGAEGRRLRRRRHPGRRAGQPPRRLVRAGAGRARAAVAILLPGQGGGRHGPRRRRFPQGG